MDTTRLQKAMGVEALVADASNGIYMVHSMVESLDQTLASMEHLQATLDAKMKEIEELNGIIAGLKASHEEALAAKDAEIEAAKGKVQAEADEALKAENENLKAENEDLKAQVAAKDEEISALKEDVAAKDQTIAEKDAEINELSEAVNPAPAANAPESNNTGAKQAAAFHVESIVKEGMSTAEKQKATAERMAYLQAHRW